MDAHWVNGRAGCRCQHGRTSSAKSAEDRIRNLYQRGDRILEWLRGLLQEVADPAAYLRPQEAVVVCHRGRWELSPREEEKQKAPTRSAAKPLQPTLPGL